MRKDFQISLRLLFVLAALAVHNFGLTQLEIRVENRAQALAQKLVGDGVIISNATLTSNTGIMSTGFFRNLGGTALRIDSGIVLTNGRAKTEPGTPNIGLDGDGTSPAFLTRADNNLFLPGDADLANELGIGVSELGDAITLEFDFVPLGDSIRFNYVLSSEEYTPSTVCVFYDAFAFFISGPGITGKKNLALVPGTSTPVTIMNVNNIEAGCINNPQYYIDNTQNVYFVHEGHTTVFTASSQVQPCQTYHLKLVIADKGDHAWDTGVFLEAKSLTSSSIKINNMTQTDNQGNSYLVEGCATGSFEIKRPKVFPTPLDITLSYAGTGQNGLDVQLLPTIVTIPANDSVVVVNVSPIVDGLPEGIETLKIFALAGCTSGTPSDSTFIQIRDYDTLGIRPRTENICRGSAVQLIASPGYSSYQWHADPSLSNLAVSDPIATPSNSETIYTCTATEGSCIAKDSAVIRLKELEFVSKLDVNCAGGTTGQIKVAAGTEWSGAVSFSLNGGPFSPDSVFNHLAAGNYTIRVRDQSNCMDSVQVAINQAFPTLRIDDALTSDASCSGDPDGLITVNGSGGMSPYLFSSDGTSFQPGNILNVVSGTHTITLKDNNGCITTQTVQVLLNNDVTVEAGIDAIICEGTSHTFSASSNGSSVHWAPATSITNPDALNAIASPAITTRYYINAVTGVCTGTDSVIITVRPAPIANAGVDTSICVGKTILLHGSGGVDFHWTPSTWFESADNIADPSIKPESSTTYYLWVKDIHQCQSLKPDTVSVTVVPAVKVFAGKDTIASINQPVQLNVVEMNNSGVSHYTWSPSTFLNNPATATPVATLPHDYIYTVTGTTPEGCTGTDEIKIKVYKGPDIYVPSGFTPNSDGLNDILKAIPVGIKEFRYFNVYNRWGQPVFSTKDPEKGWDGRFRGSTETGTFVWMAEAMDYMGNVITRKGTVTIVR